MPKLCLAQQPGRGSRDVGGDYQGINSLSDSEGSSALSWALAYVWRATEVSQVWCQQLQSQIEHVGSVWVGHNGAGCRAGSWEPEHPREAAAPSSSHRNSSPARVRTAASHSHIRAHGVLVAWEEGPTGFLPAHLTSSSGKKNTAWNSYLEGLSTQYFSANITIT